MMICLFFLFFFKDDILDFIQILLVFHFSIFQHFEHRLLRNWFYFLFFDDFYFFGGFPINKTMNVFLFVNNFRFWLDWVSKFLQFLINGYFSSFPKFSFSDILLNFQQWYLWNIFIIWRVVYTHKLGFLDLTKRVLIIRKMCSRFSSDHFNEMISIYSFELCKFFLFLFLHFF